MQKNFNTLGVMLDCSRNAVMKMEELKKFIKLISKMGYNQLQLYTEDTYEVENEELFGYRRGKYSIAELQELDAFASENGIELVPCMQTLAHLNCIFRWKKYRDMLDRDDILMVGDPKVYELIDNMFASLRKSFKTDKIHIGMDEAHNLGKGRYRDENGERDKTDILLEHLNKVCEIAEKYGFKPMMWSDMFYRLAAGGEYYAEATEFSEEIKAKIPQNVSLVYWDYYHIYKETYDSMIKGHKKLTDKVVFGGGAWKWSGFVPHNDLGTIGTKLALIFCIENGIKDAFITMWGDNGGEASAYSVLPALCVAACVNIGIFDDDEIKQKFKEWIGADYDAFMMLGLPDVDDCCKDEADVINPSKYQLYNDCLLGMYDEGGVYEGDGKNYAEISAKLKKARENAGEYGYVFDTIAALCDVLEIKAEIGVRTRKAYKADDKEELKNIVADYSEMIDRTEEFYNAFRKQWYKENKPHGFDVQDMRLGGLIMRMKNCCNTIEEYLAGDISVIDELEEEPIKVIEQKKLINSWREIITANIM